MFKFFKYLPLLMLGKELPKAAREAMADKNGSVPWMLRKRFLGAVFAFVGGVLCIHFGVTINEADITQFTDNVDRAVSAGIAIYGSILSIVGLIRAGLRKESPPVQQPPITEATPEPPVETPIPQDKASADNFTRQGD